VTLLVLGCSWILGLLPVGMWSAPAWMGAAWLAAGSPIALLNGPLKGRYGLWAAAVVLALVAGLRLESAVDTEPPGWLNFAGSEVELRGEVVSEPDPGATSNAYELRVESMADQGGSALAGGRVLAYLHQYEELLPGDVVVLEGKLGLPPRFDSFDYRQYLAARGIHAVMYRPEVLQRDPASGSARRSLTAMRLALDRSLQRALPEPEASLAAGIAFGRDGNLSDEAKLAYNRSGLRHLVAVSGSNVALVGALTYFLAIPVIGRRWAWIPAAVTIAAYLCAAGLSASVMRAGVMAAVLLAGTALGRPQSSLPGLMAAVIVLTLWQPRIALEPGFQLSASATAGLIAFGPWLTHWLARATSRGLFAFTPAWVCFAAGYTVAASIATAPIMWVTFGEVSLVSPLANLVVEPVFIVAFWGSMATAVLGSVSESAARLAGLAAFYPLAFIWWCARTFSAFPGATITPRAVSAEAVVTAYAVLGAAAAFAYRYRPPAREEPHHARTRRAAGSRFALAGAVGAGAIMVVPVSLLQASGPGELTVSFLNVGQGDATLITTPSGKQVLIDGGPSGIVLARELGEVMPHWDRSLDLVILSHPDEDHMAGLIEARSRFAVSGAMDNGITRTTETFSYYEATYSDAKGLQAGDDFTIDGVHFEVLWPAPELSTGSTNDRSVVIRVSYGEITFLFTGDSEAPVHDSLLLAGEVAADVLKVPHHGSATASRAFLDAVDPAVAVISVGPNPYGHPRQEVLAALEASRLYRTDRDGRVSIRTDGNRLRVSTER